MLQAKEIRSLSPDQLKKFLNQRTEDQYELIDVRQPMEYRQEHLPGSRLLPLGQLDEFLPRLDPKRETVFYCHSGVRSLLAAKTAMESGRLHKPVYNLEGGIAAWNGFTLPDAPKVDVFKGAKSLEDRLHRALEMEKAAYELYSNIQSRTKRPVLCELMAQLLDMEFQHARVVYSHIVRRGEELPPFDEYFQSVHGDILESGSSLADLELKIEAALSGDCVDIAELGLMIEYGAYDLYKAIAQQSRDEHEQTAFLSLAEQEKDHGRSILDTLDKLLEENAG